MGAFLLQILPDFPLLVKKSQNPKKPVNPVSSYLIVVTGCYLLNGPEYPMLWFLPKKGGMPCLLT